MNRPVHTKTFKSGNSVAVRLPKGFAIPADAEVELSKEGDRVTVRLVQNLERERAELDLLLDDLRSIGDSPDGVQQREPFEWIDRAGL